MTSRPSDGVQSSREVVVLAPGQRTRRNCLIARVDTEIRFDTEALESYAFAPWDPLVYDTMLFAASVEYADRMVRRPRRSWKRTIGLTIPVHDSAKWRAEDVHQSVHSMLGLLTGDDWELRFVSRGRPVSARLQPLLPLEADVTAVMPFSDGLDSWATSKLELDARGSSLALVRLGSTGMGRALSSSSVPYFTRVPYRVSIGRRAVESSCRSRGLKFGVISALAAYLTRAPSIIMPESGPGIFGPVLATVGNVYRDYRNHPLFTVALERFIAALLGYNVRYQFPRLWTTKGQTLSAALDLEPDGAWLTTRSCWQSSRWVSVGKRRLQCGVCAACLLRRLSIHAAGVAEPEGQYVFSNLSGGGLRTTIGNEAATPAMSEYAVAGVLHMENMRKLPEQTERLVRHGAHLATSLNAEPQLLARRLERLFAQHAAEWKSFLTALPPLSYARGVAGGYR